MTSNRRFVWVLAAAVCAAAIFVTPRLLRAGHTNIVLTADLRGQSVVGDRPGIAGDPNGKGEASSLVSMATARRSAMSSWSRECS